MWKDGRQTMICKQLDTSCIVHVSTQHCVGGYGDEDSVYLWNKKNSASQTCTQCPPAEQLSLLLLPVFSKETKTVVRARSATSRRIVHTYPTKTIALCIMPAVLCLLRCVCCPVQQSCSVQSSPFICVSSSQKSDPRTNSPSFSILACIFCFLRGCEVGRRRRTRRMGKRSWGSFWVVFYGWRECRCGEAGVELGLEVVVGGCCGKKR